MLVCPLRRSFPQRVHVQYVVKCLFVCCNCTCVSEGGAAAAEHREELRSPGSRDSKVNVPHPQEETFV